MPASKVDIRNKALKKLGILAQGQNATNAQANDLEEAYDEVYQRLLADDLVTWSSTGNVPDEFVFPVVALVAAARANEWSIPDARYQRIVSEANQAPTLIRRLVAEQYYSAPTRFVDY